ncbi:serine/arginine repetitive matrix protein 2 isoform X2 [Periplaneta americana]|uniref:serine/arginine repetitive matrix protein 2 isoform X2 n=1 Tax=Periplaneta americana TaxID=6978 RepID=UPI0037E81812
MSDESDHVVNHAARKGKRPTTRIEDSGSSSDSSFEQRKKRKKVLRVASGPDSSSSESDSPLRTSRKRIPRVMSDVDDSSGESEDSQWDENSGEEEEEEEEGGDSENASEYSSSGSEEGESSSCSDWESEEDVDEGPEEAGATSVQPATSSSSEKYENKFYDGPAEASSSKPAPAATYMSDSSDGQSEKCPICLRNFTTQEVGTPEACDHSFCVDCLQEWSKNVNTCPVDRQMFSLILVRRCLEGKVIRRIPVEPPRRQDEEEVQEDPTYCEVCGECDREDRMLLCDGCDLGYHLECLDPPMDTVPLDEWFCPDCVLSNSVQLAEEVDIQDGELMALLEDASVVGLPPLRPRVSRLLPRTRQSERVRATMLTRQRRQRAEGQQRDRTQPSTSSGIESLGADSNASVTSNRRRLVTQTTRTTRKRRKTTRRKTTKRKKRRKTTRTTKSKGVTSSKKSSVSEGTKRRHKKRRKIKRKKRKISSRRVRRPARIVVPHSVKGRLAEHLGVCPPRRPGQTIPDVRPRVTSSRIDFQRSRAGIPTLHLFGQRDQLDYFSSGSDHEGGSGGDFGDVSVMARSRTSAARVARSMISRKQIFPSASRSVSAIRSRVDILCPETETSVSDKTACDLIGSILNSQAVWHSKKSVVTINRDGSLNIKSDGESGVPKKNTEKSGSSRSGVDSGVENGVTVRTDDRLSQINSGDAPVNVSEAGSSTSGHVTQAPMYPGRSGGGGARPPAGSSFQQFGGNRYSSSPSYHGYQSGRGYSNFPPPSSFDSRGARAGYINYLNSGPPSSFRGNPLRFRMSPRYPIRRPLAPPVRPQLQQQQIQQIPPSNVEEFQPEDDGSESQKPSSRPEEEEEEEDEIDIYSDIEVGGGSGSGGPGGGGSEPDDGDRGMELGYEALPPPPIPPAMLMGMGGDALSDEEPCSDSELVIDDNIAPSSPPDSSDKYDPEKPDIPEIPESEKYDPAEPSNDTDEEEEAAAKAVSSLSSSVPPPPETTAPLSISLPVIHSSSNSNASYLHSPTYGDNSVLGSEGKLPTASADGVVSQAVQDVLKDHLESSSIVSRDLGAIADEPSERHSSVDDEEEAEECPNFSIYSAASMDIARRTGGDDDEDDIPVSKADADSEIIDDTKVDSDVEKEKSSLKEDKDENSNLSVGEELTGHQEESDKEHVSTDIEEKTSKPVEDSEKEETPDKQSENGDADEEVQENAEVQKPDESDEMLNQEASEGVKKLSLVEEIFGSDDNDSLIGGATSAVSAATVDNAPQASVTPLGLEGLDTETISETEEAINFEDDLSQDDGFLTAEEDGEIPSVRRKKKKKNRKPSVGGSVGEEAASAIDHTPQEIIDYEEGEIVDDRPKQLEIIKKDKKSSDKKEKSQKSTDENFDITSKSKISTSEEERKKKKKKSSGEKSRTSKERAVLSSSENKDKSKDKSNKIDDANIAWKKLSKSSKERNYRDPKSKPDIDPSKGKETGKKKDAASKDGVAKKEKKKKEKRKDMERYDVRKIVTDKKRKRRDAFGRDLSRERSYTKSRSRSRGRSYDRSRGRSRSLSRSRITRSKGRSPIKSRIRSRSRSRFRSRSRSRNRSRSRSKTKSKVKSKDRLRKSRSKDKQRSRISRSRSRGRRSRSRTRSRSRNRSRLRSRSRTPVRSRDRRERSRERRGSQRCRYRERRSWSHSWTPSWSRSHSPSCSSYSRSRSLTPRRFNRSYSRSFSRSWSRERHERIPVIEKKSGAISKTAKKLTVIVPNTKDDSERHRKKEKKRKEGKKNKESINAVEKRKKRKEKSPAPSKEVFTSGDNILVSVNFKSNKSSGSKDIATSTAIAVGGKETSKRKHDGSFELEREPAKKLRKDKGNKEKLSPRQKNGLSGDKGIIRSGEKKSKKGVQKMGNKVSRVAALVNKKPVAIIDLDQSPFHEQTPSPTDLIVLSDSEEEGLAKDGDREELADSLNSRRTMRPNSSSPKSSSKQGLNTVPGSTIARTPESQSPPMNAVGSYLVTSTGPKTPPEPQIKFSIPAKTQLRTITNPLREDEEDMMAEDQGLDDLDQRIEEELDRGLGEVLHKGPNTPPEPRGPTTPCSPPTSPDAYDPFDPTKSGTPSPVGAGTSMDGPPSPVHTPTEQLIQHSGIGRESPMVSDLEDLASKSLEARVTTPTLASAEEVADQSSQSPERSKLSVRGDTTMASSPSIVPETTSLPPPVSSDNEISQPSEMAEGSEKSKQISVSLPPPGPTSTLTDTITTQSPERSIPVVITSQQQAMQGTPVKPPLFPNTAVKQVAPQPITSTPTHSTAPAPVFPTLTPANIASILCTPPPSTLPLGRMALFNPPVIAGPAMLVHHHPQQQQQQQQQQTPQHLMGSPIVVQPRPPPTIVRTTPEKLAPPSAKLPPVRSTTVQNGEQTQTSQKQPQDTTTDVVDMDLESPYSPGSSEGDDLFEPPTDVKSSGTATSFTALGNDRNRTAPPSTKNSNKLPPPLAAMLHKSPSKPPVPGQDKFDSLFGLSPLRVNKTAPARTTGRASAKAHHAKSGKTKQGKHDKGKSGKKEIAIKMDEDQLQILDDLPSSAVELQVKDKFLKKLNRQERVVEEVKLSLKPHYTKKHITKEEYKDILRRSVPKICHNKSGEINPIKISCLVEAYVKKYRYAKKKNASAGKTKMNKTTMWS